MIELVVSFDGIDPPHGTVRTTAATETVPGIAFHGLLGLLRAIDETLTAAGPAAAGDLQDTPGPGVGDDS